MTRVRLIGIKPEAVDFSAPDLPPGTIAERIAAGIGATLGRGASGTPIAFNTSPNDIADAAARWMAGAVGRAERVLT